MRGVDGVVWISLVFVLLFLLMVGWITVAGNRVALRVVDCIIVPGALVHADGMPGSMLGARISNAVRMYREGWARAIIFTGGAGESGPIEAVAARAVAIRLGLPPQDLFVETVSHTTYENFVHAREIMRENGWRTCLVSTDPFHILRCVVIARSLGIKAWGAPAFTSPGYTHPEVRLAYTLRECAGMVRFAWQHVTDSLKG